MAASEATLRDHYQRLPDARLLRLATEDAARLRPEALALLQAELAARGLGPTAEKAIAAQLRVVSDEELLAYCQVLRAQPCPVCRSTARPLNATRTHKVKVTSFIVLAIREEHLAIACPACLDDFNRAGSLASALLGWWCLPWGIIRTRQAIKANDKMLANNHLPYPNDLLKHFVAHNVGRIEAAGSRAGLWELLAEQCGVAGPAGG